MKHLSFDDFTQVRFQKNMGIRRAPFTLAIKVHALGNPYTIRVPYPFGVYKLELADDVTIMMARPLGERAEGYRAWLDILEEVDSVDTQDEMIDVLRTAFDSRRNAGWNFSEASTGMRVHYSMSNNHQAAVYEMSDKLINYAHNNDCADQAAVVRMVKEKTRKRLIHSNYELPGIPLHILIADVRAENTTIENQIPETHRRLVLNKYMEDK